MKRKTSTCAIAGFILSFFSFTPGLILSIVGLDETKRYDEDGKGLAIAGIVISVLTLISTIIMGLFLGLYIGYLYTVSMMSSIYDSLDIPETSMEDRICSYGDYYYTGRYGQKGYISCGPTSYTGRYVCEYVDEYGDLEEVTCYNDEY